MLSLDSEEIYKELLINPNINENKSLFDNILSEAPLLKLIGQDNRRYILDLLCNLINKHKILLKIFDNSLIEALNKEIANHELNLN